MNCKLGFALMAGITAALCAAPQSFAGAEGRGGGDLACDAKMKSISANIKSWTQGGGPDVGKLDLTSSAFPNESRTYTLVEYEKAMLNLLKMPLDSECVSKGDRGYPVQVGDDSKVCVSFVSGGQIHMRCDQVKLLGMTPDQQIEQIHHEYAIHVPGLEADDGPISTYKISSQLSAYTRDVVERRLVVIKKTIRLLSGAMDLKAFAGDLLQKFNASSGNIPPLNFVDGSCDPSGSPCFNLPPGSKVAGFLPSGGVNRLIIDLSEGSYRDVTRDTFSPKVIDLISEVIGGPLGSNMQPVEYFGMEEMSGVRSRLERIASSSGLAGAYADPHAKWIEFRAYDSKIIIFVTYPGYVYDDNKQPTCMYGKPTNGLCTIGYYWEGAVP